MCADESSTGVLCIKSILHTIRISFYSLTVTYHAGKKSNNRQFDTYGAPYGQNDIVGCLLDWDNSTISFTKNGENLGAAFQIPASLQGQALYPAICLKNAELVVNFGEQGFQHGPPQGFVGLAKAKPEWTSSGIATYNNLPEHKKDMSLQHFRNLCKSFAHVKYVAMTFSKG